MIVISDMSGYWTININIGLQRITVVIRTEVSVIQGVYCLLIAAKRDIFNAVISQKCEEIVRKVVFS